MEDAAELGLAGSLPVFADYPDDQAQADDQHAHDEGAAAPT